MDIKLEDATLEEFKNEIENRSDFKRFYCDKLKRNYWTLGYLLSNRCSVIEDKIRIIFANDIGVSEDSIFFEEILRSNRFKHNIYVSSTEQNQIAKEVLFSVDDFMEWVK